MNINIIQTYAPTADKPMAELEAWYKELEELLKVIKKEDLTFIIGDFNAKIGQERVSDLIGDFGLGDRNDRGERLVEFCQQFNMVVTNTWFKHHPRRLYTWTSPQHTSVRVVRNQIDFIMVNKRYQNSVISARTYPGADIGSDHNPVVVGVRPRWKIMKKPKPSRKPDIKLLRDATVKQTVSEELNKHLADVSRDSVPASDVDNMWKTLKGILNETTETKLKSTARKNRQEWMTEEILNLMDARRESKVANNLNQYKHFNRIIRVKIKRAKESWMESKCSEIEDLQRRHDFFNLHKKVKEFTLTSGRPTVHNMRSSDGKLLSTTEGKLEEWEKYIETLFGSVRTETRQAGVNTEGPNILKSEVEYAIKQLKTNKSPGLDEIYPEILKLISENNTDLLVALFNRIYETGKEPEEWLESLFIPLPKKTNPKNCRDFRLISLMSQVFKVLLKIIHNRIFRKCEVNMGDDQFGFRKGMGTREALFSLMVLAQKCYDQQRDIFICFIDFEKAFDRVRHDLLMDSLRGAGLDEKDTALIQNIYWNQSARIRIEGSTSGRIKIRRGVRQGCILSPLLFNLYSELIFNKALADISEGIKVNGVLVNTIRYADDTVLIADSDVGLQRLLNSVHQACEEFGMKINIKKTKVMVIKRSKNVPRPVQIDGQVLEQVDRFRYLGCWVDCKLDPDVEVRSRIEQARNCFVRLKKLLSDSRISLGLRLRLSKCYVWSTLLYGAETWTLKANTINKLEAFEMWTYRRILKISWTSHTTNEEVLRRLRTERELFKLIKVRKTTYLDHILRNDKYRYAQLIVKGKIEGRRGLGRKKLSWLRNIRQWTGLNYEELIRTAENREKFATVISNLH